MTEESTIWKSCCGLEFHPKCVQYCTYVFFSLSISTLCIVKLILPHTCHEQSLYVGILLFLIGALTPSPNMGSVPNKPAQLPNVHV
jgi:hypothetical protein